ncbi:MAG: flagellar hook-length control protein FliK [Eubacteriales bacterium]
MEIRNESPITTAANISIENKTTAKPKEKDSDDSEFKVMFDKGVSKTEGKDKAKKADKSLSTEIQTAEEKVDSTEVVDADSLQVVKSSNGIDASQLAAMMKGSMDTKGLALAKGVDISTNPGRINLLEKLDESKADTIYDAEVWKNKRVKDIVGEIKANGIEEKSIPDTTEASKTNKTLKLQDESGIVDTDAESSNKGKSMNIPEGFEMASGKQTINVPKLQVKGLETANENKEKIKEISNETKIIESPKDLSAASNISASGIDKAIALNNQTEVAKAEPYSQIGKEIITKLEQKGPMEFTMQLKPEDLGPIDIKLKMSDGKLVIDIMAASSKTQALLVGQVDKLVANLGLSNVKIENIQVSAPGQAITEQQYVMNGGMSFFHRRNQEQDGRQNSQQGTQVRVNVENSLEAGKVSGIRNQSNKMDYAV